MPIALSTPLQDRANLMKLSPEAEAALSLNELNRSREADLMAQSTTSNRDPLGKSASQNHQQQQWTLKQQQDFVVAVRKENFDLKLRIHYLEEHLGARGGRDLSKQELLTENIALKVKLESLKHDHELNEDLKQERDGAQKQIIELTNRLKMVNLQHDEAEAIARDELEAVYLEKDRLEQELQEVRKAVAAMPTPPETSSRACNTDDNIHIHPRTVTTDRSVGTRNTEDAFNEYVTPTKGELRTLQQSYANLEDVVAKLQDSNTMLRQTIMDERATFDELEAELRQETTVLHQELTELRAEHSGTTQNTPVCVDYAQQTEADPFVQVRTLKSRMEALQLDYDTMATAVQELETENDMLRTNRQQLAQELNTLQQQQSATEQSSQEQQSSTQRELASLLDELGILRTGNQSMQTALAEERAQTLSLQTKLHVAEVTIREQETKLSEANAETHAREETLRTQEAQIREQLEAEINARETELRSGHETEARQLQAANARLVVEVDTVRKEMQELQRALDAAMQQKAFSEAEAAAANDGDRQLRQEMEELRREREHLAEKIKKYARALKQCKSRLVHMVNRLNAEIGNSDSQTMRAVDEDHMRFADVEQELYRLVREIKVQALDKLRSAEANQAAQLHTIDNTLAAKETQIRALEDKCTRLCQEVDDRPYQVRAQHQPMVQTPHCCGGHYQHSHQPVLAPTYRGTHSAGEMEAEMARIRRKYRRLKSDFGELSHVLTGTLQRLDVANTHRNDSFDHMRAALLNLSQTMEHSGTNNQFASSFRNPPAGL
eukprot:Clim_evm42s55 gene=Clim_evmTU42s55